VSPELGSATTVRGIVVGHGSMAQGLVEAALRISGAEEGALVAISNDGMGPEQLKEAILSDGVGGPTVVFTDLAAGSCTLAARVCCREGAPMAVVTGVNLAMLLDFVFHRDLAVIELVERVVERGRAGVRVLSVPSSEAADADPALSS